MIPPNTTGSVIDQHMIDHQEINTSQSRANSQSRKQSKAKALILINKLIKVIKVLRKNLKASIYNLGIISVK